MDNRSIIKEWLRDSAIAFVLIVAGILASRPLADWFELRGGIGYVCALAFAGIPFAFFLGLRRGFFLWWEYLGFFACIVSMTVARDWLVKLGANKTLVVAVVSGAIFGCFICLHEAVRRHLTLSASNGSANGKTARP